MTRELGVISDFQSAEILMAKDNLTLGFDATTQEGVHVNSLHATSQEGCQVIDIDQLPGTKSNLNLKIVMSMSLGNFLIWMRKPNRVFRTFWLGK